MLQIDKNIPLPALSESNRRGGTEKYPLRAMQIGDSFYVEAADPKEKQRALSGFLGKRARRFGIKIETRMVNGGVRIWRVA